MWFRKFFLCCALILGPVVAWSGPCQEFIEAVSNREEEEGKSASVARLSSEAEPQGNQVGTETGNSTENQTQRQAIEPILRETFAQIFLPVDRGESFIPRFSSCGETCLRLESRLKIDFMIEFDLSVSKAEIVLNPGSKILKLSSLEDLTDSKGENLLMAFLVGHETHPYQSSPHEDQNIRAEKIFKPEQDLAFQAFKKALADEARSFLHIAPTGMGKTAVMTKALKALLSRDSRGKILIVTADRIQLIHQLFSSIREEMADLPIEIINWSATGTHLKSFKTELGHALSRRQATVFVITSQSLKRNLESLEPELYRELSSQLLGLFIDEAHHLGAPQTQELLYDKLFSSGEAFLYGATATPIHRNIVLTDLFERKHWSYLADEKDLFSNHLPGEALKQLSLGIERGSLTPFDDLYILGEPHFKSEEDGEAHLADLFVAEEGAYVLNPDYYPRLIELLYPIFLSNKKGFIVTATIQEAERLTEFLSASFKDEIDFSAYHSGMEAEEKKEVLAISERSLRPHYIVAVRALDEGVDMPHLSGYVDLNVNVSVGRMIHRIGRVLRLREGKIHSDIVFLSNFRSANMARDLLNLLDSLKGMSFSTRVGSAPSLDFNEAGGNGSEGGGEGFLNSLISPISRKDLRAKMDELEAAVYSFWSGSKRNLFLSFEEAQSIVQEAGLSSIAQYYQFRKEHPEFALPSAPDRVYGRQGKWKGWRHFLGERFLSFEEAQSIVQEAGVSSEAQYQQFRKEHPEFALPSAPTKTYGRQGKWKGWGHFLGVGGKLFLSFEEAQSIVQEARVSSAAQYQQFRKEHPEFALPSAPARTYRRQGKWKGWGHFLGTGNVLSGRKEFLSFEEAQSILQEAGVSSRAQYQQFRKEHPEFALPSVPEVTYGRQGKWENWRDFIGERFLSFEEAQSILQEAGVSSKAQYQQFRKEHPEFALPSVPAQVYGRQGKWRGARHFFGTQ